MRGERERNGGRAGRFRLPRPPSSVRPDQEQFAEPESVKLKPGAGTNRQL